MLAQEASICVNACKEDFDADEAHFGGFHSTLQDFQEAMIVKGTVEGDLDFLFQVLGEVAELVEEA
jgi:hypothetical protein